MSAFDAYVQAKFHGGTMAGGPCFTVVHDAETPLRAGYADSIAEFFRVGPKAGTSAHAMVDPVKAVKLLPDNIVAYAAGPKANPKGWHLEQAGYAKFKRPDWTTPDGMSQLQRVGGCLREVHDTWSIPKRWMTDDQLRRAAAGDRASGGMTTHQQVARVLGGTTHTDPEENYPRDLLLEVVLHSDKPATPAVQEESNMTVIQPGDEAVVIKGVGHTRLRIACDTDWQRVKIVLIKDGKEAGGVPGSDINGDIDIAPNRVSVFPMVAGWDFAAIRHLGVGGGGSKKARPVTVDTAPPA